MATTKVMCLKLISGEEIIGAVTRDGAADAYVIENPIYIQLVPKPDGQGVTLNMVVPFLMYAKTRKFNLPLQSVLVSFEPSDDMRNAYSTQHGSGIIIPEAPKIDPKALILG